MARKTYQPKLIVLKTPDEVDTFTAESVMTQIYQKPDSVLILPTGNTQIGWYRLISETYQAGKIDLSKIETFNLDEYYPIKKNHPNSYFFYMKSRFVDKTNVRPDHWHIPNGEAPTAELAVENYQKLLCRFQPADLAILGLGPGTTCHIGFNERGSAADSKTRYVMLNPQTIQTNSLLFPSSNETPKGAITLGINDILKAKKIILLAKGEGKAWGVNRTLNGPINSVAPASFLRLHPDVTFITDLAAASLLKS